MWEDSELSKTFIIKGHKFMHDCDTWNPQILMIPRRKHMIKIPP